jgi:hypothetical protein
MHWILAHEIRASSTSLASAHPPFLGKDEWPRRCWRGRSEDADSSRRPLAQNHRERGELAPAAEAVIPYLKGGRVETREVEEARISREQID